MSESPEALWRAGCLHDIHGGSHRPAPAVQGAAQPPSRSSRRQSADASPWLSGAAMCGGLRACACGRETRARASVAAFSVDRYASPESLQRTAYYNTVPRGQQRGYSTRVRPGARCCVLPVDNPGAYSHLWIPRCRPPRGRTAGCIAPGSVIPRRRMDIHRVLHTCGQPARRPWFLLLRHRRAKRSCRGKPRNPSGTPRVIHRPATRVTIQGSP